MRLFSKFDEVSDDQRAVRVAEVDQKAPYWDYLLQKDRHLLELHHRGLSYRQIGEILLMNRGSVSRRIATICERLNRPLVRTLELAAEKLDESDLAIGRFHFAGGMAAGRIAKKLQLPASIIQRKIAYLTGLLEEMSRRQNRMSQF